MSTNSPKVVTTIDEWFLDATEARYHPAVIDFVMDDPSRYTRTDNAAFAFRFISMMIYYHRGDPQAINTLYCLGLELSGEFALFYAKWLKHAVPL